MELFRVSRDIYGREVLQGMSGLFVGICRHRLRVDRGPCRVPVDLRAESKDSPIVTVPSRANLGGSASAGRVVRHALPDRVFHWVSAACVLTLLGMAFLPIVGVEFAWVALHWITGLVLGAAVLFHVVRVLVRGTWRSTWLGRADWRTRANRRRDATPRPTRARARQVLRSPEAHPPRHHSRRAHDARHGGLPPLRIDTPWGRRNPYGSLMPCGVLARAARARGTHARHDGDDARQFRAAA